MPVNQKKILIVEDEPNIIEILREMAMSMEYEILEARDGEKGLEAVQLNSPDLIILDIMLPKKDGIAVLKEFRKQEWGKNIPVILFTNLEPTDEKLKDVQQYPPIEYIVKTNITLKELKQKISEMIA